MGAIGSVGQYALRLTSVDVVLLSACVDVAGFPLRDELLRGYSHTSKVVLQSMGAYGKCIYLMLLPSARSSRCDCTPAGYSIGKICNAIDHARLFASDTGED